MPCVPIYSQEKDKGKETFTAGLSSSVPQDDVVIAQPKVSWNSRDSVNASMSVHWVGDKIQSLGQTFTVATPFRLRALTLEVGEVKTAAANERSYAISLFSFKDKGSVAPASLVWTATGRLPASTYEDFTSDGEKKYLTFTLPETSLEAGQVYGLVISATADSGNWKDLVAFHNTWGSVYEEGKFIIGRSTKPGDLEASQYKDSNNDLTFWIQGK